MEALNCGRRAAFTGWTNPSSWLRLKLHLGKCLRWRVLLSLDQYGLVRTNVFWETKCFNCCMIPMPTWAVFLRVQLLLEKEFSKKRIKSKTGFTVTISAREKFIIKKNDSCKSCLKYPHFCELKEHTVKHLTMPHIGIWYSSRCPIVYHPKSVADTSWFAKHKDRIHIFYEPIFKYIMFL